MVGRKDAANNGVTGVVGARIPIGAGGDLLACLALSGCAGIAQGAGVTIVAGKRVLDGRASGRWMTGIGRAIVLVVTFDGGQTDACTLLAGGGLGAGVLVVAFHFVIGKHTAAFAARIVRTRVSVVAIHLDTGGTLSGLAGISHRAWLAVVAIRIVGHVLASGLGITAVVGTAVIVGAKDGVSNAFAGLAMVALGAGVAVKALSFLQRLVGAASLALADVVGAGVPIVAGCVIDETVAVVVNSVTHLDAWNDRVAFPKPFVTANSHAGTGANVVLNAARTRHSKAHGQGGATAYTGVGNALETGASGGIWHLLASVSFGARCLESAGASTKTHPVGVVDADARARPHAPVGGGAGQAEGREIRDTDVLAVAAVGRECARPAVWTACIAGLGADLLAHVGGADLREAVRIFITRLAKAPLAWRAFRASDLRGIFLDGDGRIFLSRVG